MDLKEVESGETNVLLDLTKWKGGVEMEGASVALQEENESRMLWRTRLMLRRLLFKNILLILVYRPRSEFQVAD